MDICVLKKYPVIQFNNTFCLRMNFP